MKKNTRVQFLAHRASVLCMLLFTTSFDAMASAPKQPAPAAQPRPSLAASAKTAMSNAAAAAKSAATAAAAKLSKITGYNSQKGKIIIDETVNTMASGNNSQPAASVPAQPQGGWKFPNILTKKASVKTGQVKDSVSMSPISSADESYASKPFNDNTSGFTLTSSQSPASRTVPSAQPTPRPLVTRSNTKPKFGSLDESEPIGDSNPPSSDATTETSTPTGSDGIIFTKAPVKPIKPQNLKRDQTTSETNTSAITPEDTPAITNPTTPKRVTNIYTKYDTRMKKNIESNGVEKIEHSNGRIDTYDNGKIKMMVQNNGTIVRFKPDGTTTRSSPHGTFETYGISESSSPATTPTPGVPAAPRITPVAKPVKPQNLKQDQTAAETNTSPITPEDVATNPKPQTPAPAVATPIITPSYETPQMSPVPTNSAYNAKTNYNATMEQLKQKRQPIHSSSDVESEDFNFIMKNAKGNDVYDSPNNGKRIIYQNGDIATTSNVMTKLERPDGTIVTRFNNGNTTVVTPEGLVYRTNGKGNASVFDTTQSGNTINQIKLNTK